MNHGRSCYRFGCSAFVYELKVPKLDVLTIDNVDGGHVPRPIDYRQIAFAIGINLDECLLRTSCAD